MDKSTDIPSLNEPDFSYAGNYSYADYLRWTIDERLELIKGKIFRMSPAPNLSHQSVVSELHGYLWTYLRDKSCRVFTAPFDVRLPQRSTQNEDIITVVQPDICVICDLEKLDEHGCIGAPDVVVEILSPSNNSKDLKNKYQAYEEAGVKEYWIVSPQNRTLLIYTLRSGKFIPSRLMTEGDVVQSTVLPGFSIDLAAMFQRIFH